jgi:hypothetical protein
MLALQRLLGLLLEDAKDQLLVANPQTFGPIQAEAIVYADLIKKLTVARPELPKE